MTTAELSARAACCHPIPLSPYQIQTYPLCVKTYIWVQNTAIRREMGRLDLNIESELEQKFRSKVYERKGMKKGNITQAIEEAVLLWIETEPNKSAKKSS